MATKFNNPNYSFVIETKTKGGQHLCYWRIDQVVSGPNEDEALQRVENQIARHLGGFMKWSGLVCWVTLSGQREVVDTIVKNSNYEIS